MTQSYFGTLKRHGVKLSVALFLGYLFHVAMAYLAAFLLIIFAVFIGSVASLLDAEPSEHGKIVLGAVFFLLLFLAGTLPKLLHRRSLRGCGCLRFPREVDHQLLFF